MSTTVDERVVSMQFDNRNFEKNVSTSMSTLEKLKQSLNFKGSTKGLEAIGTAAQNQQVDFRNLEATACTAAFSLRDIWIKVANVFEYQVAGRIIGAGKRMISALTIDPIRTGLQEYETQLNSVQTILANTESKGSTLEDVNKALDELNLYADKTIYNFTEMTRNIGTFTAAGVDLETSVSAIKGIANLAAVSGSTSQQASTAMYQLSQALSTGTVRLMDWNSVVNAGMGGQVFQDALKETARVHGVAIDSIIEDQGSFRESLSEGWLSSEILLETLNKFTGDLNAEQLKSMGYTQEQITEILKLGETANNAATKVKTFTQLLDTLKESAQSGWAQTWELIIGDFEAARSMWTKVSDVIGGVISDSAEARNALLSGTLNSGLTQLFGAGIMDESGYEKYLKAVAKEHGVALDKMIEEEGSLEKALRKGFETKVLSSDMLSEAVNRLSGEYGELSAEQLKSKGYTQEQVDALLELNKNIQNGSISIDEFADKMSKLSGRELIMESFANIWKSLVSIVTPIKEAFNEIFPPATANQLYKIIEAFKNFTSKLILSAEQSEKLKQTFKGLFSVLDIIWTVIKTVVGTVFDLLGNFSGLFDVVLSITAAFGKFILGIRDTIKESNILSKTAEVITKIIQKIIDCIKQFASALKEKFQASGFDGFIGVIKFVWNLVKTVFGKIAELMKNTFNGDGDIFGFVNTLIDLLNAGLLTSLIIKFKGFFSSVEEVAETFGGLFKDVFGGLGDTLQSFQDKLKAESLKSIATALLIVAASLLVLSSIPRDRLEGAIAAIGISLGILVGALKLMSTIGSAKKMSEKGSTQLIKMSFALILLATALKKLGSMSWAEIARGLTAMTGALAVMLGSLFVMSKISSTKSMSQKGAAQLIKMSFSLLIVASSLKILSTISWDGIARGLSAMGGAFGILSATLVIMSKISSTKSMSQKGAAQLVKMSYGLLIVAASLKILSTISWDGVGRSLAAMGGAFAILTITLAVLSTISSTKNMAHDGAKQLSKLSKVLLIVAASLKILSTMSWDDIGRSLTAMGGAFGIMLITIGVLSTISSRKKMATEGAGLLLTLSAALLAASVSLKLLSTMGWDGVARSLTAMAGAFIILVGSLAILSKISSGGKLVATAGALLILAAAMGVLVPTLLILGNMSIGTIIQGLLTMAAALAIFGAAGIILQGVIPAILGLAGAMLMFGAGVFLVTSGIGILCAGLALLVSSIAALVTAIVAGGTMAITLIVSLVQQLIEQIPLLLAKIAEGIIEFCKVIRDGAPVIGEALVAVLLAAIDACVRVTPVLTKAIFEIIVDTLNKLTEYLPKIVEALVNLIIGVIESIAKFLPKLIAATVRVLGEFFDGLIEELKKTDPDTILKALASIGIIAALIVALNLILPFIPGAMLAILGVGAIIAEIAIVLAAIGALSKIPGLTDLIKDGGNLLQSIGTALGQFVGGIVGGIAKGITNVLPGIGADLSAFMINVTPFLNGLKLVDSSMIGNCASLAAIMLTITGAGVVESLIGWGTNVLPNIASDLSIFMTNITPFITGLRLIDETLLTNAKNLASLLLIVTATSVIESLTSWFTGGVKMEDFAKELVAYGKGIKEFAETVNGVDGGSVEQAAKAGKAMVDIVNALPKSGGLKSLFSGEKDLSDFGKQLKGFGEGIKKFSDAVQGVSGEIISSVAGAAKTLFNTLASIPATVWSIDATNLSRQLLVLSLGMTMFVNSVPTSQQVSSVAAQLKTLTNAISDFSKSGLNAISDTVANAKISLTTAISSMLQEAISLIEAKSVEFKMAGTKLVNAILEAVLEGTPIVVNAYIDMIKQATAAVSSSNAYNSNFNAGRYIVQGLARGISTNASLAISAAASLATSVNNALRNTLRINSPSKVAIEDGEGVGEGLVVGLNNYSDKVSKAGSNMANDALYGIASALVETSDLIENGIDSQPTITPVLDLSEVRSGIGELNSIFDTNSSVGVLSRVSSIGSNMNKNQNGSEDITSAIKDLKSTLQNTPGNTYNFGNFTYSAGDEIDKAVQELIRAIKVGGRA